MSINEIIGQRFGQLVVQSRHPGEHKQKKVSWNCLCDCGNTKVVLGVSLRNGHTRSCGCLKKTHKTTHGMSDTPEFRVWWGMLGRCYNKKSKDYPNYGGRGILVSDEWLEFEAFYRDMGPRPSPDHTIERDNNDLGYSKGNCRWATRLEQSNNRSMCRRIEFDGEIKSLAEWCRELGLNHSTMTSRLNRGMTFEDAIEASN